MDQCLSKFVRFGIKRIPNFHELRSHSDLKATQSKVARCLARQLLPTFEGSIESDFSGRPYFQSTRSKFNANLSISHSGEWVAVGINLAGLIGIDIEQDRPLRSSLEISRHYFSERETSIIEDDPGFFLKFWTVREALGKLDGNGVSGALSADPKIVLDTVCKENLSLDNGLLHTFYRQTGEYHFAAALRFHTSQKYSDRVAFSNLFLNFNNGPLKLN